MTVGWFKKGFFLQKLDVGAASTKTSGLNVSGTITMTTGTVSSKTVTATSQVTGTKGLVEGKQKLTHSTGQAALNTFGASFLSATAASTYTLGPPAAAGVLKHIFMSSGSANLTVKTTATWFNSTCTKINMIGGKAHAAKPLGVTLVGATGGKWAVINAPNSTVATSTALTFS